MLYELKTPSTTASFVFEVLFEGVKVGELCHEFIPGYSFDAGKPAIVFYPHNIYNQSTGKGLVLDNGGSIDYETLQYTAGSDPAATSLFTENGTDFFTGNYLGYTGDNSLGCVPCRITDYEGNAYKIMKIGSQYWMAENLRTLTDGQGQAIASDLTEDQWKTEEPVVQSMASRMVPILQTNMCANSMAYYIMAVIFSIIRISRLRLEST